MKIARSLIDQVIAHALEERPNECCGVVASRNGEAVAVHRAINAEASPFRYSFESTEQLRLINRIEDSGLELGAIYHSHTRSPAYPSQTDMNLAFYPDSLYLIVSLEDEENPDVRAFEIKAGRVKEVALEVFE